MNKSSLAIQLSRRAEVRLGGLWLHYKAYLVLLFTYSSF